MQVLVLSNHWWLKGESIKGASIYFNEFGLVGIGWMDIWIFMLLFFSTPVHKSCHGQVCSLHLFYLFSSFFSESWLCWLVSMNSNFVQVFKFIEKIWILP